MDSEIEKILRSSAELKLKVASDAGFRAAIGTIAGKLKECVTSDGTIYACGNGGSACDAMHLCEELTARYKREREGFRAMHFMDPSFLTCWGNDYEYDSAFGRAAKVFCRAGDVLIAISTSGNSENVLQAVDVAKQEGCYTVGLTGKEGGKLKEAADLSIVVPSTETERIQEVHITIIHILCELLET